MPSAPCPNSQRIDFFSKTAPYYDFALDLLTFGHYAEFQKRAIEVLAPRPGEKILDLCSGTGRVASWIAQAIGDEGEIVGMDITETMVKVAKERYGGLKNLIFVQTDVTKPFGHENYFDGIFTSYAIHELPESKRQRVFENSYLALKDRGRIVIADFNPHVTRRGKTILLLFFKLFERGNLNFFSFDQTEMLERAGFNKIKSFPVLAGLFQITLAHK